MYESLCQQRERGYSVEISHDVAKLIGLDTIGTKCLHLDSWIKRLEELGAS